VHVDDYDRRLLAQHIDHLARDAKRIVDGRHEHAAHHVEDPDLDPAGLDDPATTPGRAGRVVRGPNDAVGLVERATEFAFVPNVVAGGDEVHACREHLVGRLLGEAEAAGGVFAVRDHHVGVVLFADEREMFGQRLAARRADHVGDGKDCNCRL